MATLTSIAKAREHGYLPIADAAAALRQLADDIEQANVGRLAKITLNVYYKDPAEFERASKRQRTRAGRGDNNDPLIARS